MSRNRRLRPSRALTGAAGAVALTGLLALSGCGTGQLAQTANQISAVNGVSTELGEVQIRDARIAFPPRASGATLYPAGGVAPLEVTLVNSASTADRLIRVSSPGAPAVRVGGDTTMPQGVPLVAQVAAEGGAPQGTRPITIELGGLVAPIRTGLSVPVTLTFERAGSVDLQVPIAAPAEGSEPERVDSKKKEAEAEGSEQASPEAPAPGEPAESPAPGEAPAARPGAEAPAGGEGGS